MSTDNAKGADCSPKEKFQRLVEPKIKDLMISALRLTGGMDATEDLVQETLVRALKNIEKLDETINPGGWLYTIMKNIHLNNLRRDSRREVLLFDESAVERLADERGDQSAGDWIDDDLQIVLNSLPVDMRLILVAREVRELSYQEIAESFDIPIGTVRSRLKRGREALKEKWEKRKKKLS